MKAKQDRRKRLSGRQIIFLAHLREGRTLTIERAARMIAEDTHWPTVYNSVSATLRRMQRRGFVRKMTGQGRNARYALAYE